MSDAIVVNKPQKPLLGKITITSDLIVETGLHIGGGGENLDIGGLDKPIIRNPLNNQPYLPGSSLKGKLRSILERLHQKSLNRSGAGVSRYESDDLLSGYTAIGDDKFVAYQGARDCQISRVFGSTGGTKCWIKESDAISEELDIISKQPKTINNEKFVHIKGRNAPARLIVRDCHLEELSVSKLKQIDTGLYMTEWKFENSIDRITAAANPRQFERVPAGAQFKFELVYTVEDRLQVKEDLQNLAIALAILEDDALGGHGSRGYGKIRFANFGITYRSLDFYKNKVVSNDPSIDAGNAIENITALMATLDPNNWPQFLPGGEDAQS